VVEFFKRLSTVALVFAIYLACSYGVNQLLFNKMKYVVPKGKTILIVGDSQMQRSLDPEIVCGSVNVSLYSEPYMLTYPKLKRILNQNPHLKTVLLGYRYHLLSASQDQALSEPLKSAEMIRRYYPIMGWSGLADLPHDGRQLFVGTVREGLFLNRNAIKRFIPRQLGGEPDPPYIGAFGGLSGTHLRKDLVDRAIKSHFGTAEHPIRASSLQINALSDIAQLTQARGIQLVLVGNPENERYSSRVPVEMRKAFEETLREMLTEHHVNYIDGNELALPDESFFDPRHLNREGARRFSHFVNERLSRLRGASDGSSRCEP
jgi:hypothetical protein